jgi:hypothetical protein
MADFFGQQIRDFGVVRYGLDDAGLRVRPEGVAASFAFEAATVSA